MKKSCFKGCFCSKAFTLIELLVVVLIIGILAAIAFPQYQVAVEKARVAQILPMMRHIYDALAVYKLQHGYYYDKDYGTSWDDLGIEPPAGFGVTNSNLESWNDNWYCFPNEESSGYVYCSSEKYGYDIWMFQPDEPNYPEVAGKRACVVDQSGTLGERLCKSLGKQSEVQGYENYYFF